MGEAGGRLEGASPKEEAASFWTHDWMAEMPYQQAPDYHASVNGAGVVVVSCALDTECGRPQTLSGSKHAWPKRNLRAVALAKSVHLQLQNLRRLLSELTYFLTCWHQF